MINVTPSSLTGVHTKIKLLERASYELRNIEVLLKTGGRSATGEVSCLMEKAGVTQKLSTENLTTSNYLKYMKKPTRDKRNIGVLDPIQYEIYRHRMFQILEEGRIAVKMVSGSPVVVEGGESMCSFYLSDGTPILTAAGILLHCTGASDFIIKAVEWFEEEPGIREGDQFFFNDPYIGGNHLPDMIVVKPIFFGGRRIAWTATFMHTPDTGGMKPGGQFSGSTSIFQEGIRIRGLKIVEQGKMRNDVFQAIVQQCRDPHLVGLDTKARIAANNVCAKRYLAMVENWGLEFIETASKQIVADSEKMAEAILDNLPDGVWESRMFGDTNGLEDMLLEVRCRMTKKGRKITFDFTGSSPQAAGNTNCTLAASKGALFTVLASQLFWNIPWNGGMLVPVKLIVPEGTILNCNYPAACCNGVNTVGKLLEQSAHRCISEMLFEGGQYEGVTSGWSAASVAPFFGGVNQYGAALSGTILDCFAAGIGATTERDGVDSGGVMMNPSSSISDVEILEMNYPFLYLARRQAIDSGGSGEYDGGMGVECCIKVHGTKNLFFGFQGHGTRVPSSFGLFGGYPGAPAAAMIARNTNIKALFQEAVNPNTFQQLERLDGRKQYVSACFEGDYLNEEDVVLFRFSGGGGYGDPLDRPLEKIADDLRDLSISRKTAENIYGVVFTGGGEINTAETGTKRLQILKDRLGCLDGIQDNSRIALPQNYRRLHENTAVADMEIHCSRCGFLLSHRDEDYRNFTMQRTRDLEQLPLWKMPEGRELFVELVECYCPGCGTLLEVDTVPCKS